MTVKSFIDKNTIEGLNLKSIKQNLNITKIDLQDVKDITVESSSLKTVFKSPTKPQKNILPISEFKIEKRKLVTMREIGKKNKSMLNLMPKVNHPLKQFNMILNPVTKMQLFTKNSKKQPLQISKVKKEKYKLNISIPRQRDINIRIKNNEQLNTNKPRDIGTNMEYENDTFYGSQIQDHF